MKISDAALFFQKPLHASLPEICDFSLCYELSLLSSLPFTDKVLFFFSSVFFVTGKILNSGLWSLHFRKGPSLNVPLPKAPLTCAYLAQGDSTDIYECWAARTPWQSVTEWVQPFVSQLRKQAWRPGTAPWPQVHLSIMHLCLKLCSHCFIWSFKIADRETFQPGIHHTSLLTVSPFQFIRLISQPHWDAF